MTETKKVVKKVAEKPETKFKYSLRVEFNDKIHEVETDDIGQALYDLRPAVLKTRVIVKGKSAEGECDKLLLLNLAKMMWRSRLGCDIFAHRIIFK